jgi:protoheme IX farnesyltransferase
MRAVAQAVQRRGRVADFLELTKPGITTMVLLTAAAGYWMGLAGSVEPMLLFHVLAGTGLSSAGACALNMVLERKGDARMRRTRSRPIPAGRIRPWEGVAFGGALAAAGVAWLWLGIGWVAGAIAAVITVGYLFAYTPLKPVSSLSTFVGAQVGAAPPLIGWFAARGDLGLGGWTIFAIIVFWQWPHILAMAWMNRHDFKDVDYPLAPVFDGDAGKAARLMVSGLAAQVVVSLGPFFAGIAGWLYAVPAVLLGGWWLGIGIGFARDRSDKAARKVFLASLLYLPLLLIALVIGK